MTARKRMKILCVIFHTIFIFLPVILNHTDVVNWLTATTPTG